MAAGTQIKGAPTTGKKESIAAMAPQRKAPWISKIRKVMVRIAPWKRAMAPLEIRVVRTIFLNSSRRVAVFSLLKGIAA